ncbi:hypothetical protein [Microbacterium excoecariae]|uniref:phage major capsid protein n=1 Tax=Microbacterium excoecariae TaxID=2715210 RepID=UPI00140CA073|nr:hypothetical protein [Microbacterium excoecariae]NHI16859.1 hypothetical protein [Microbacterium excoecariae]
MTYTYPAPAPTVTDGDTASIHHLLKTPSVLARRIRTLADKRYIADMLLTGRYQANGGAILYEDGEPMETNDDPEAIAPGAAYPLTKANEGTLQVAKTTKWGRDVIVTDEAIARLLMDPVDRAFAKLVNRTVRFIDTAALSVIASRVTATFDVTTDGPGAWTGGDEIVESVLLAKQRVVDLEEGYDPTAIVLTGTQWAKAVSRLNAAGLLPREGGNPLTSGTWPQALGLTWLTSPHTPSTDPMLLDTTQLGGMADEQIGGPGYISERGVGVETKSLRDDDNDRYKLRARRVTVPVVREAAAGIKITNTGL